MPFTPYSHIKPKDYLEENSIVFINKPIDTLSTSSLFEGHLLSVKSEKPQLHFTQYNYLISTVFLLLYIAFVWLYVSNRKKLVQVFKAFYQTRFTNQNTRDEFSLGNQVSVFLSIFFVATLSIFVSKLLSLYGIHLSSNVPLELMVALLVIAVYGIKLMTIKFLGYLFQVENKAAEYMMSIYLFCNVLGLFMLPLVFALTFAKEINPLVLIYGGAILILAFVCIRIVRGVYIGLKSPGISKVYLFMYLCALELLPFILMLKLIRINILSI